MSVLLFPVKLLLLTLDFLLMLVTFGWVKALAKAFKKEKLRSEPVGDDPSHRVYTGYKNALMAQPREGIATMHDLAVASVKMYGSRQCMGVREFLGQHSPKVKAFGPTQWKTYEEVGDASLKFGAALRSVGLVAAPDVATLNKHSTPCCLAIFENTCPEWMISALGAFSQSIIVTTIYATLGMDGVIDAINDGVITTIVCNQRSVAGLLSRIGEMKTLKTIIYTDFLVAAGEKIDMPAPPKGVKVVFWPDFVASGSTTAHPPTPPKGTTCSVIMYTSGSTGKPKGVVMTHATLIASLGGLEMQLPIIPGEEVYLAYLPLAHVLELIAEFGCLYLGATLCYADPKTLSTTGAYPIGALEQYKPTMMAGVPKIWDVLKKGIQAKVAQGSKVAQFLVATAFEARQAALERGYDTPLFKALVFKKFAKATGGRLRIAISGGGPLNSEVQKFVSTAFGTPLFQGYALTETCAGLAVQDPEDRRTGIAGVPLACGEVKLVSTPDVTDKAGMPYLSTDVRDVEGNPIFGRGEILVRGNSVSLGYYMMPEKTKEDFLADGFFKTGDIGQFMTDGSIRIVDRKKNLVKLKGGEYIALENMEMAYGNSSFVDAISGGICCYGDGDMDRPVALMQLNEPVVMKWASANGVEGDFAKVKDTKKLKEAVMADLLNEGKKAGLSYLEMLKDVCFLTSPWTPENGCLTAANKLQRRAVIEKFKVEFEAVKQKGILK